MKLKIIRILLVLLLLADMIFIFSNSAQNSTASAETSKGVTELVAPVIIPEYAEMNEEEKAVAILSLNAILREAAHLLQFTPIGFCLYLLLSTYTDKETLQKYKIPLTLGFGLIYAISDEIHQLFSPGRAFELFDIFMDISGVTVGCFGAIILLLINKTVQNKMLCHIR